ncbi:hypothetical protein DQ384_25560 [Sphaerisporangium album]|uniref:Uncharacterized protein n=1 Tax=Sphaerisporangium album TaxID=509200 RepID=A0A367FDH3_9ACTN|nr:hypothetical protein [Sphaerisporangium album]RCG27892.1 hypothetical protein DQ384_25560 [Sphaerisporangium album]
MARKISPFGGERGMSTRAVAGWLFADLLAALVLVVLGAEVSGPAPGTAAKPAASSAPATPSPSPPSPSPSPSPVVISLSVKPEVAVVRVPGDAGGLRRELRGRDRRFLGARAGLVLTFGAGDATTGSDLARTVNRHLRASYPKVFSRAVMRDFHDGGLAPGTARLEIYLFTGEPGR